MNRKIHEESDHVVVAYANRMIALRSAQSRSIPGVKGFSAHNIWRMRAFYLAYTQEEESFSQRKSLTNLDKMNNLLGR